MASLLEQARAALGNSYAPYSEYEVGAALETADGTVYTGCNIENANYSNSLHAEEVALGKAISDGHREFDRLAVTSRARDGVTPCGMCRQTLAEFCGDEFEIICEGTEAGGGINRETETASGTETEGRTETETESGTGAADGDPEPSTYELGELLPETITRAHLEADER